MKKLFLVLLLVIMASAMAFAQVTPGTPTSSGTGTNNVAPTVDVLGAHNNYGRGCAGCHAPHSGAAGAGGNAITGQTVDPYSGDNALFAQDMGPLFNEVFDFSDITNTGSRNKYVFTAPTSSDPIGMTSQQYSDFRGILMCLACHDGVVAKGAMMQNHAYEQQIGALPTSYGGKNIPTLLGIGTNIGLSTAGNYNNDHPIGEAASLDKVLGANNGTPGSGFYGDTTNGIVYSISASNSITGIAVYGEYNQFVTSYGAPALFQGAYAYPTPVNTVSKPYLVCTTCHNQHVMNVYAASTNSPIQGAATGTYATYFFINAPYNVNDVTPHPTKANSTTQFCRECHFGESNEANGGTLPTSF